MYNTNPPTVTNFSTNIDYKTGVELAPDGVHQVYLLVEGMHCGSCVWLIENALKEATAVDIVQARVNLTTKRLVLQWRGKLEDIEKLVEVVHKLGYRLVPYKMAGMMDQDAQRQKALLWDIGVSGFAFVQVMMLAFGIWWGNTYGSLGPAVRQFLHIIIAMISIPATIYAGRSFFRSAYMAIRAGHSNMDVPIAIGVIATLLVSIQETFRASMYTYYDSALMLIFVLLISRYLDIKVRNQARQQAQDLLLLRPNSAMLLTKAGAQLVDVSQLKVGDVVLVAVGDKIPMDGRIVRGQSTIDTSIITGETVPQTVITGADVYAGTINISAPIEVQVTKVSEQSLIAEIIRLIENATQSKSRFVQLADRIASWYTPVVLFLAVGTLLLWLVMGVTFGDAILYAASVLLITCPCAVALAVPAVQIVASTVLLKNGIMLKSSDALERLVDIDIVACDKTGTLTMGMPELLNQDDISTSDWELIAAMAVRSKHPLCQAITRKHNANVQDITVEEEHGMGLSAKYKGTELRLGRASFCGVRDIESGDDLYQEMWFANGKNKPVRLKFADVLRPDAKQVIAHLQAMGYRMLMLSGDRQQVATSIAAELGIAEYYGQLQPQEKYAHIQALEDAGGHVLMLGDGLNDVAVLKRAYASISPASGVELSQNSADIVFYGAKLEPVVQSLHIAKNARNLVRQNFAMAFLYNILAVPVAVIGLVTPVFAALAMSISSIVVVLNALRLRW